MFEDTLVGQIEAAVAAAVVGLRLVCWDKLTEVANFAKEPAAVAEVAG